MDRAELARACVEVEKAGGSVREFLAEHGCISPWGTWYRLQKEELHRKEGQITDGKGRVNMARKITLEQKKKVVQIAIEGGDPLEYLRQLGSKNPSGLWWTIKNDLKAADPELYAKIPRLDGKKPHIIPPEEEILKPGDTVKVEIKGEPVAESRVIAHEIKLDENGMKIDEQYVLGNVGSIPEELPKIPDGEEKQEITKPVGYFPKFAEPVLPMDLPKMFPGFQVTAVNGKFGQYRVGIDPSCKEAYFDFDGLDFDTQIRLPQHDLAAFVEELTRAAQILGVKIDKNEDKTA